MPTIRTRPEDLPTGLLLAGHPPQVPDQVVTAAIACTSALQVLTFRSLQGID
jgi:hypothetical protein